MRHSAHDQHRGARQASVLIATEVVLPWPREVGALATVDEARQWPVFVLVVSERPRADVPSAAPLLDLVDHPRRANELAVVAARCQWSVVDNRNALLRAAIQAEVPVRFTVEILVAAREVPDVLDIASRGGTIGVTTPRHIANLDGRVDVRTALQQVVLLSCGPSTELARLADLLRSSVRPA